MIAIILAAGLGTRLKPLTLYRPKPLINYRNNTLLGHQIEKLLASGVSKIYINTAHDQLIPASIKSAYPRAPIIFFREPYLAPYGTVNSLYKIIAHFGIKEPFILLSADIYTTYEYDKIQISAGYDGLALLTAENDNPDFGIENGQLTKKGMLAYANMGIYQPKVFNSPTTEFRSSLLEHKIEARQIYSPWKNVGDFKTIIQ